LCRVYCYLESIERIHGSKTFALVLEQYIYSFISSNSWRYTYENTIQWAKQKKRNYITYVVQIQCVYCLCRGFASTQTA